MCTLRSVECSGISPNSRTRSIAEVTAARMSSAGLQHHALGL